MFSPTVDSKALPPMPVGAPPMLHACKVLMGRPTEGAFLTLYRKTQPFLRMSQSCGERSRGAESGQVTAPGGLGWAGLRPGPEGSVWL